MIHLPRQMRTARLAAAALLAGALAGCGAAYSVPAAPTPADIPRLRARLAQDSTQVSVLAALGAAQRAAGHPEDALPLLERAHALEPSDPTSVLYLGLVYEDLSQPQRAASLYEEYQRIGRSPELKRQLRGRIPLLHRQELVLAARRDIANEATLAQRAPAPRSVAVFPFIYQGDDPNLEPLSRALSELLVTDLGQVTRLDVLERTRVQLLLDEMDLARNGLVDSTTAARSGKLLGTATVIQGQMSGTEAQLQLRAAVVPVTQPSRVTSVSEADPLSALFDMQKRLSLSVIDLLGIELTPAERERVLHRPTSSIEALLAYGRCLESGDAGEYATAAAQCDQAAALDPSFSEARSVATSMGALTQSAGISTDDLAQLAAGELVSMSPASLNDLKLLVPEPFRRQGALEVEGTEGGGGGSTSIIEIVIPYPAED